MGEGSAGGPLRTAMTGGMKTAVVEKCVTDTTTIHTEADVLHPCTMIMAQCKHHSVPIIVQERISPGIGAPDGHLRMKKTKEYRSIADPHLLGKIMRALRIDDLVGQAHHLIRAEIWSPQTNTYPSLFGLRGVLTTQQRLANSSYSI